MKCVKSCPKTPTMNTINKWTLHMTWSWVTKLTLNFNFVSHSRPWWHSGMFSISVAVAITKLYCLISQRYLFGGGWVCSVNAMGETERGTCLSESHIVPTARPSIYFNSTGTRRNKVHQIKVDEWLFPTRVTFRIKHSWGGLWKVSPLNFLTILLLLLLNPFCDSSPKQKHP